MSGSPPDLRSQLETLEQSLHAFGAPIAGAFRRGSAPEQVREKLEQEGVAAAEDLVTWWSWHDGAEIAAPAVDSGAGVYLRPENTLVSPWHVLSLAEAIRSRH